MGPAGHLRDQQGLGSPRNSRGRQAGGDSLDPFPGAFQGLPPLLGTEPNPELYSNGQSLWRPQFPLLLKEGLREGGTGSDLFGAQVSTGR